MSVKQDRPVLSFESSDARGRRGSRIIKAETRARRLKKFVTMLSEGKKIHP